MRELLVQASDAAILLIDALALVVILWGTLEAFVRGLGLALGGDRDEHLRRVVWLRYARWLVGGLTFQLAADLIETSIAPGWDDVGRLAAIAAVRTFLNYFLERDLAEVRERDRDAAEPGS